MDHSYQISGLFHQQSLRPPNTKRFWIYLDSPTKILSQKKTPKQVFWVILVKLVCPLHPLLQVHPIFLSFKDDAQVGRYKNRGELKSRGWGHDGFSDREIRP